MKHLLLSTLCIALFTLSSCTKQSSLRARIQNKTWNASGSTFIEAPDGSTYGSSYSGTYEFEKFDKELDYRRYTATITNEDGETETVQGEWFAEDDGDAVTLSSLPEDTNYYRITYEIQQNERKYQEWQGYEEITNQANGETFTTKITYSLTLDR